jgi:hypothetical protein
MFAFVDRLSPALCQINPEATFVFGDNLINKGEAGQAIIRKEPNAFGVPTKKLPSMSSDAFFSDSQSEYDAVRVTLKRLWTIHLKGGAIVLPKAKIGSGLARLQGNAPKIAKMIDDFYIAAEQAESFEVVFPGGQQSLSFE